MIDRVILEIADEIGLPDHDVARVLEASALQRYLIQLKINDTLLAAGVLIDERNAL